MDLNEFNEKLKKHIEFRLDQSKIKITDLVLEELISFAMEDSKHDHLYESGSHKKGGDISTDDESYSIKSSKIKNDILNISSFRLTRYGNDLDAMIYFIDNDGKNFDKYFVLARNETTEQIKYSFYTIPSNIFSATEMKWIDTKNKNNKITGWNTIENDDVKLKIVKSMSNQLWIEINTEFVKDHLSFEIIRNISDLGKNRFIA
jgi:hypothetical protein